MARQCLVVAIQHKHEAESSAHEGKESSQLKPPALSINKPADDAKCEDLVKVTVGDDLEKFF